ncbi:unnamed protein product [Peronospora belbahrii]|uniref:C2H2-type domain-containing protein n=1 Tax=Peronospora belbahrii TaxID=622444 RepID=A0ABN8CZ91_9STRA|nr:unnamed protein product [Peronospora belbahrii]
MQRFTWCKRSEELNWQLLSACNLSDVLHKGDPAVLEPYALHVTFARLPACVKASRTRDAWFLVHVLQLSMEYLLSMRAKDGNVLKHLSKELQQVETERDISLRSSQKWKAKARSGDEQVKKLYHVLQKIADLLQIHGASSSAVDVIATLLMEMVLERRAKKNGRVMSEDNDDHCAIDERLRPIEHKNQACEFCGQLFSSVKFLEEHLVRRHSEEDVKVKTPVKYKMRQNVGEDREDTGIAAAVSEATMQKLVQRVERVLQEQEVNLRSIAKGVQQQIKQIYDHLDADPKLADQYRASQSKAYLCHEELQRKLGEVFLQKKKAEEELAGLTKQIRFLNMKMMMMMKAMTKIGLTNKSDGDEMEINDLQLTLGAINADLEASREELETVQASHISSQRSKKELADTVAVSHKVYAVMQRDQSSQTWLPVVTSKAVQSDEISSSKEYSGEVLIKLCTPMLKDEGTDPLALIYEDVGIQTVDFVAPSLIDEEVQIDIKSDLDSTLTPAASPIALRLFSQELVEASKTAKHAASPVSDVLEHDKRQINRQDLLDIIAERAQRAASKAASNSQDPKKYSSIPQHKYVRSRFQHDEDLVKKRIADCLLQLEQSTCRYDVPAQSARLSEDNVQIVQQALHGHLKVLPFEVLKKMVDCENTANALVAKEWEPIKKTHLQALERHKLETRSNPESGQDLVRQALATFGTLTKTASLTGTKSSGNVSAAYAERLASKETLSISHERKSHDNRIQDKSTDSIMDSVRMPARRYSSNNQLTIIVGEDTISNGVSDDFEKSQVSSPTGNDDCVPDFLTLGSKGDLSDVARSRLLFDVGSLCGGNEIPNQRSNIAE